MLGSMLSHDNCNPARVQGDHLVQLIEELALEQGIDKEQRVVYQGSCHNPLRNTWMDHIETYLATKLEGHLKHDLELIPKHLHVACRLSELLLQVDNEYSLKANYANPDVVSCQPSVSLEAAIRIPLSREHSLSTMFWTRC